MPVKNNEQDNHGYNVRSQLIDNKIWVAVVDIIHGFGMHYKDFSRFLYKIPDEFKTKKRIGDKKMFLVHEVGCQILIERHRAKNRDFADFMEREVLKVAEPKEKKVKVSAPQEASSVIVPQKTAQERTMEVLSMFLDDNQKLMDIITKKIGSICKYAETKATLPVEMPANEPEKIYFLPAKRKEWRLWINRIVDKLAIKDGGEKKIAAAHIWDGLYKHLEKKFDISIKQLMREANSSANYKLRVKSRLGLIDKNDKWMMDMLKNAYDIAVRAEIELPRDFKLVKITDPVERRSA